MPHERTGWRNWGDHPLVVALGVFGALAGIASVYIATRPSAPPNHLVTHEVVDSARPPVTHETVDSARSPATHETVDSARPVETISKNGVSTADRSPDLVVLIHRITVMANHCSTGDRRLGIGFGPIHGVWSYKKQAFIGEEHLVGIRKTFRNSTDITISVAECDTEDQWLVATVLATKDELGKGAIARRVNLGYGNYEVYFSVKQYISPYGHSADPLKLWLSRSAVNGKWCHVEKDSEYIDDCFASRENCEKSAKTEIISDYKCVSPHEIYCHLHDADTSQVASCFVSKSACELSSSSQIGASECKRRAFPA
jgi:hypothetical protein